VSPENRSGNPARRAEAEQTVKQQREAKRQEKLVEYQRQLSKRKRTKLLWWVLGAVAVLVVAALIVFSLVTAPKTYKPGSEGAEIEGVQTFEFEGAQHVEGTVEYEQDPPAGGPHNNAWLTCAVYDEPQQNEYAVHALEHGAVWITYDPELVTGADLDALRDLAPRTYAIVSPYPGLDSPIAVSAWEHQLKVDEVSDPRIAQFIEEYWQGGTAPELGASCTGIEGPGKV